MIRCWHFGQVSQSLRILFLDRLQMLGLRPRKSDWVLDVSSDDVVLPTGITDSVRVTVQTQRMKATGNGRYFVLVPGEPAHKNPGPGRFSANQ